MSLAFEGCIRGRSGASMIEAKLRELNTLSVKVVDRDENGDKCPYCGSSAVEIVLWDFTPNKPFFEDVWTCTERNCYKPFIMRTKRGLLKYELG